MEKSKITSDGRRLLKKISTSRDLIYLITRFLPIKKQLQLRFVCKDWRHSISYSWKLQVIELEIYIQVCIDRIPKEFDPCTLKSHKDLSDTETCIASDLKNYIKLGGKGDMLFSSIKEIGYLVKPNHLIQKNFFATCVLLGKTLPFKGKTDFMNKAQLDKIWFKIRGWLKQKDFMKDLKEIDINKVTAQHIADVNKIYENDQYMSARWIRRESSAALNLFLWTKTIIQYKGIIDKMMSLGIKVKEDKIEEYRERHALMVKIYDRYLSNYAD